MYSKNRAKRELAEEQRTGQEQAEFPDYCPDEFPDYYPDVFPEYEPDEFPE